jgi:hypothetical protein
LAFEEEVQKLHFDSWSTFLPFGGS